MAANTTLHSNQTTLPEGDLFTWHGAELIIIPIMVVLGCVGNLLVLYIYHYRWKSTTVTLFKRMLAALDLCTLVLAFPTLLHITIKPHHRAFVAACAFASFIALGTAIASAVVLVIIAVDRFKKLCLLRKVGVGKPLAKKLFAASVVLACLINIPTFWIFGRDSIKHPEYGVQVSSCFINNSSKSTVVFIIFCALLGSIFMAITVILVVLYARIIKQLRDLSTKHEELKRRPSLAPNTEAVKKQKRSQMMRSTAIVFIVVTIMFFVSYTPYFCTLIVQMLDVSIMESLGPGAKAVFDMAKLSPLLNNVTNPFIYSFTSVHFRKEVKKMLTFKTCQKGNLFRRRGFSMSKEMSHCTESMSGAESDDTNASPKPRKSSTRSTGNRLQ